MNRWERRHRGVWGAAVGILSVFWPFTCKHRTNDSWFISVKHLSSFQMWVRGVWRLQRTNPRHSDPDCHPSHHCNTVNIRQLACSWNHLCQRHRAAAGWFLQVSSSSALHCACFQSPVGRYLKSSAAPPTLSLWHTHTLQSASAATALVPCFFGLLFATNCVLNIMFVCCWTQLLCPESLHKKTS